MAKSFKPINPWRSRSQTRILHKGRWIQLQAAKSIAGHIVAKDAREASEAAKERLRAILG